MKATEPVLPLAPLVVLTLLLGGQWLGCESEDVMFQVDCNECYGTVPDSANLIVYLTINQENPFVPITVYRGSLEDGQVDWRDTATSETFYLYSALDAEYTVEARYHSGDKTIVAYDGDHMYLYDGGTECGSPCYLVKGGIFDNRLLE
jgi:hypothetical protein